MTRSRRLLLKLHWLLGITLGASLSFMALSGVTMSFEDEIMQWLTPQMRVSVPADTPPLPLSAALSALRQQRPGERLASLQIERQADRAWTAAFQRGKGQRNQRVLVNPYDGRILGEATGAAFFDTVRNLHRFLSPTGANPLGRWITGASAVSLIFFALSGLWLSWTAGGRQHSGLRPDFRLSGRAFYRRLHQVAGRWLALFYLISALSGLWWSSQWYREGVSWLLGSRAAPAARAVAHTDNAAPGTRAIAQTDDSAPAVRAVPPAGSAAAIVRAQPRAAIATPAVAWDRLWLQVMRIYGGDYQSVLLLIPPPGKTIRIRLLPTDAAHARALDNLMINPRTLAVEQHTRYRQQPVGDRLLGDMDPLHTGALFGLPGRIAMLLSSLCLPLFFVTGLLMYRIRRRQSATKDTR